MRAPGILRRAGAGAVVFSAGRVFGGVELAAFRRLYLDDLRHGRRLAAGLERFAVAALRPPPRSSVGRFQ